ncbi:MAG: tetratricopeptide repeat protein [Planctomycetota bacterium]
MIRREGGLPAAAGRLALFAFLLAFSACSGGPRTSDLPNVKVDSRVAARRAAHVGETARAASLWRDLRRANPRDLEAWVGEADGARGEMRATLHAEIESFRSGLTEKDDQAGDFRALSVFTDPANDPAAREAALENLRRQGDESAITRALLGRMYLERGEPARAESEWTPIEGVPFVPLFVLEGLAEARLEAAEREAALEALLAVEERGVDDFRLSYNVGTLLMEVREDYEGAAKRFARARHYHPDDLDVILNQSSALILAGKTKEGGRILEAALEDHPDSPDLLFNLGVFYADHENSPSKAIASFERYLEVGGEWKLRVERWLKELREKEGDRS